MAATPFQLSRIYAKGWRAGKLFQGDASPAAVEQAIEKLNPCTTEDERARWERGFKAALLTQAEQVQARAAGGKNPFTKRTAPPRRG